MNLIQRLFKRKQTETLDLTKEKAATPLGENVKITPMLPTSPEAKALGCILGGAIGDALGSRTEFHVNDGSENIRDLAPTWHSNEPRFSDDTQMALAIAESILSTRGLPEFDVNKLMTFMGHNFVRWDDGDPRWGQNDRSPGGTCLGGVRQLRNGAPWYKSGTIAGKGNGSVMRVWPIGVAWYRDPEMAFHIGATSSIPTHNNLEALMAAAGCAYLVATSIQGTDFVHSVGQLVKMLHEYPKFMDGYTQGGGADPTWATQRIAQALAFGLSSMTEMEWKAFNGNDGKGLEALAAAIFYNVRSTSYEQVVVGCANYTVDSDSTACIAGAIAGARWGINSIRADWRQKVEKSAYLHDIGNRLFAYASNDASKIRLEAQTA